MCTTLLVCEGRCARHVAYMSSFYCLFICKPKKLFDFACLQKKKKNFLRLETCISSSVVVGVAVDGNGNGNGNGTP